MTSRDFVYMLAHKTNKYDARKALDWKQGGKGVVMGWVEHMKRRYGTKRS